MSSKTAGSLMLTFALLTTAAVAGSGKPAVDSTTSDHSDSDTTIWNSVSRNVHRNSHEHALLLQFLARHNDNFDSRKPVPNIAQLGDFRVSYSHKFQHPVAGQTPALLVPFDPTSHGKYSTGDTFVAVTCTDGACHSWHFVYEPASASGTQQPAWLSTATSYQLLLPTKKCPPANQWLPNEAKEWTPAGQPRPTKDAAAS